MGDGTCQCGAVAGWLRGWDDFVGLSGFFRAFWQAHTQPKVGASGCVLTHRQKAPTAPAMHIEWLVFKALVECNCILCIHPAMEA
jgi:hypothetical protein